MGKLADKLERFADKMDEKADRLGEKNEETQKRYQKKLDENSEKVEQAKVRARRTTEEYRNREKPTEQEKFYKRANIASKGIAFYFALPLFFGIALVIMILGFQIWEWLF